MRLCTLHRAFVLVAVLLVGGVAAPVVHRVQHARHAAEQRAERHAGPGHVHAAQAAFSTALPDMLHGDVVCIPCTTWTSWSLLRSGPVTEARRLVGILADAAATLHAQARRADRIRGPPRLF